MAGHVNSMIDDAIAIGSFVNQRVVFLLADRTPF